MYIHLPACVYFCSMLFSHSVFFSLVVPVYNRPGEVNELLASLAKQTYQDFEVIIIEDGSTHTSKSVVDRWKEKLEIQYISKENSGPGPSRNVGFANMKGHYAVVFDSDCEIPPHYLAHVKEKLNEKPFDAWGGPDRADQHFSVLQKAMAYTMAAFLTTGGIRGGKKHIGKFQPRSFNMGLSKKVIEATQGFAFTRFAEDIELSIRMEKSNFNVVLLENAFVYHKRRTTLSQFFKQVFNFGRGRVLVGKKHPGEIKLTHWIPAFFNLGCLLWLLSALVWPLLFYVGASLLSIYFLAIGIGAAITYSSVQVGLLAIPSAFIQLTGYGFGFLKERFK
ncbi:MAG: glycosyltransferase [Chryseotalea sp.]|jgi:glycosyltransferase involved in cell wall biosynthesis